MKTMVCVLMVLCMLCNVPKTCNAYTPERNLATFGQTLFDDLRGLVSAEEWLASWVPLVERGEPIMWFTILLGGSVALQVLPKKTLQKYITPMPLIPKSLVNAQDVVKLKKLLRTIDKNAGTWQRILRLFK